MMASYRPVWRSRIYALLAIAPVLFSGCSEDKNVEPGIPLELAQKRKAIISELSYDLFFDIPQRKSDSIPAKVSIQFSLTEIPGLLQLDFNARTGLLKSLAVNGSQSTIDHQNEHILISSRLREGKNKIDIEFVAGDLSLNRNDDYLYTLFVPDRASTCFPSFDQPDLKGVYNLTLQIPTNWEAISNGKAHSVDTIAGKKKITFDPTQPISTYHFAFTAGKYRKAASDDMTMLYRENDTSKVHASIDKIFELHRQAIQWLEEYSSIDYPFEKFDFALIPSFQYGGMEHPGSIFYKESSLMLDPSASINQQLRRASLISHETAHMWFGNLVTMKWFNDVWLKEVFANFMAAKIVNPAFPEINHELRFLMSHYPSAYEIDRSDGTHPIQQELANLKNAGTVYGAIIYQKAPIMMRNLENLIGEDRFQSGLRDYLKTYSYSNASWDDLIASLKKFSDADLDVWNNAWIKNKGMPEIRYSSSPNRFAISVVNDESNQIWPQSFSYLILSKGNRDSLAIEWSDGQSVVVDRTNHDTQIVVPNLGGQGYGYFQIDPESQSYLLRNVDQFDQALVRAGIWMVMWESMLHYRLDPEQMFQNLSLHLEKEKDPLLLEYLADKVETIFWQFLNDEQRLNFSSALDNHVFELIALEKDQSRKRTLFNCYRNTATSTEGENNLLKFWRNEITLGLELSERDHIDLAYEIALRNPSVAREILDEQESQIKNPDRKKEFHFVRQAVDPSDSVRDAFFESLKNPENRSQEPWVASAVRLLHHPLQAATSIQYIAQSLELLPEIQLTGDIFFPKAWLDATLSEYQSAEAAAKVRQYLDDNPNLPNYLKNKLLQSSDMLFRAAGIQQENIE